MNRCLQSVFAALVVVLGYWISGAPWERGLSALLGFYLVAVAAWLTYNFPRDEP
jgi:hypothetical protein